MRSVAVLLVACLLLAPLAAQSSDERVGNAPRRLSLVLELGPSVGGPGAGLAAKLRQAGFDDTSPEGCFIFCSGPTAHPTQEGPGAARALTARVALSGTVAIGVGYGNTSLGGSIGYRASASVGDYVPTALLAGLGVRL